MISGVSKLQIFNIALGFVGTRTISDVDENSPEANQCNLYWDRARRSVLHDYPYDFAIRRYKPTAMTVPAVYSNWTNCYQAPDNALKVWSVHSPGEYAVRQPFEVGYLDDQIIVLCNVVDAHITCAVDVTNLALWSEQFVTAMSRKLALLIANALLKNNPSKIQELNALYEASLPEKWRDEQWAVTSDITRLSIYNRAIGLVGGNTVSSLSENRPEAIQCSIYWDNARRSVLRDYPFRFAIRRSVLDSTSMPTSTSGEWSYAYEMPINAIRVLSVHSEQDKHSRQPFVIEYLDDKSVVLCNISNAEITYISDVTDVALWDEQFVSAMTHKLALLINSPLSSSSEDAGLRRAEALAKLYESSLPGERWREENWSVIGNTEQLNIYNRALSMLGCNMVSSLEQNTPEAVQCNLHWDNARRAVLRDYPFDFAIRKVALEETTMPTITRGTWKKAYLVPSDSLRVLSVFKPEDTTTRQAFTVQYHAVYEDPPDPPPNKIPSIESFAHTIKEDGTQLIVTGNALEGSTLGDGTESEHSFVWGDESASYGTITKNPDGSYTYELNNDDPQVQQLGEGDTLTETFTYTYTDVDGDTATGNVTITIRGSGDDTSKYYEWEFTIDTRLTRTDIPVDAYENVERYEYDNPNVGMLPFTLKHSFVNGDASLDIDWGDGTQSTITKDSYTEGENDYWSASRHVYDTPGIYTIKVGSFDWDNVYYDRDKFITSNVWRRNVIAIDSPVPPFAGIRGNVIDTLNVSPYVLEKSLVGFFDGCTSLERVCSSIFSRYGWGDSLKKCFRGTAIRTYPATFFRGCYNVTDITLLFQGSQVEYLPEDLFEDCTKIRTAYQAFVNCDNLNTLPKNILAPCVELEELNSAFSGIDFPDGLKITSHNLTSLSFLNSGTDFEIDEDEESETYKFIYRVIKEKKQHYEWCVWRWNQGLPATFTRIDEAWRDSTINGKEIVI